MRGKPQDYVKVDSLAYEQYCRDTYKVCVCGRRAIHFAHLYHLGKEKRSKPNWKHLLGVMLCHYHHALYDGRITKESGLEHFYDETGIDLAQAAMKNLLNYLPFNMRLKAVRAVAQWLEE